jgi:hypothetical protein
VQTPGPLFISILIGDQLVDIVNRVFKNSISTRHIMVTAAKKAKKAAKKAAKSSEALFLKQYKGWTRVTCQAICGCCDAVLLYKTKERADEACRKAYLKHVVMVDDREPPNEEKVDGFFGFNIEQV